MTSFRVLFSNVICFKTAAHSPVSQLPEAVPLKLGLQSDQRTVPSASFGFRLSSKDYHLSPCCKTYSQAGAARGIGRSQVRPFLRNENRSSSSILTRTDLVTLPRNTWLPRGRTWLSEAWQRSLSPRFMKPSPRLLASFLTIA